MHEYIAKIQRLQVIPIYYINLSSRPERRAYMEAQLQKLGLAGVRIEAVTPADLTATDIEAYCNPERQRFLWQTELACTLSHEKAWHAIVQSGHTYGLVLEDDVELSADLPTFLADAADLDLDLIRIETTGKPMRLYPAKWRSDNGIALRPFRSTPRGAAGYLIRNDAAKRLIGDAALRKMQFDLALFSAFDQPGMSLSRAQADPALCRQMNTTAARDAAVAQSSITKPVMRHVFAENHKVQFFWMQFRDGLVAGLRNAIDHLAQQRKGLQREVIPFGRPLD